MTSQSEERQLSSPSLSIPSSAVYHEEQELGAQSDDGPPCGRCVTTSETQKATVDPSGRSPVKQGHKCHCSRWIQLLIVILQSLEVDPPAALSHPTAPDEAICFFLPPCQMPPQRDGE
ncbi:hypothetical protein GN956_G5227 [Arapaima gigas]